MGFSRQEYWSGLHFPSQGDLPNPGIQPGSLTLQADSSLQTLHFPLMAQGARCPAGSALKESACNEGDLGRIPGLEEGMANPLQGSCPGSSMDREAWWATVCGVTKSRTQLSKHRTFYPVSPA